MESVQLNLIRQMGNVKTGCLSKLLIIASDYRTQKSPGMHKDSEEDAQPREIQNSQLSQDSSSQGRQGQEPSQGPGLISLQLPCLWGPPLH